MNLFPEIQTFSKIQKPYLHLLMLVSIRLDQTVLGLKRINFEWKTTSDLLSSS